MSCDSSGFRVEDTKEERRSSIEQESSLKGLRALPPTAADLWIFRTMLIFGIPLGFGILEGLQSMGNGCGLQTNGFSTHFDQYDSISRIFMISLVLAPFSVV